MAAEQPYLIAFSGHRAGYDETPARLELEVILRELQSLHPHLIARSSVAEGADLLFLQVAQALGIPTEVYLPLEEQDFAKDFSSTKSWEKARQQLTQAQTIHQLSPPDERPTCYHRSGVEMLENADLLIALWDGLPARGPGGTAHIIEEAKARSIETRIIPATREALVSLPDWAEKVFSFAQLTESAPPQEVLAKTDSIAEHLAPDTRRMWKWILTLQGAAVLVPLLWFFVLRTNLPVTFAAIAMVICTMLVITVCWWLRWRGMQTTWTQARIIAEIARSATATKNFAPAATSRALEDSPDLHAIARRIVPSVKMRPAEKSDYLIERIEDQRSYYERKLRKAMETRRLLSRYVTLSLDGSLFLAVAGLVLAIGSTDRLLRLSGADLVIGLVGAALPLCSILLQMLGSYLELNRRTGRFSQQITFLVSASHRLANTDDPAELELIASDVERQLLGEVVEWYYQSKLAEPYYRARTSNLANIELRKLASTKQTLFRRALSWLELGASFIWRVIFGRLLVAALSVIITTALIAFLAPKDPSVVSTLRREDGRLLSSAKADGWHPNPDLTENGFLLIAHGLHDGVLREDANKEGKLHWMTRLQDAIEGTLGSSSPDICLVDWHFAAIPIHGSNLEASDEIDLQKASMPTTPTGWLQDIAAIRSQGEEIGDLVGFKIARAIRNKDIDNTKPMHFIGHSAGGFVVLRAALVLQDLGLASPHMKITMLDTPLPVRTDLEAALLNDIPIDFYCTSEFAQGVPPHDYLKGFHRINIPAVDGMNRFLQAHSYAHKWYIDSVLHSQDPTYQDGFARSPFAK